MRELYCIKGRIQRTPFQKEKSPAKSTVHSQHENRADRTAAKGTKVKYSPFSSAGLLYPEYAGLQCLPPSISEVSDRRHGASKKVFHELLLANCGVLFRGCKSAQAVIVSVIITTCSRAPFRFHHLGSIKQPVAGSSVDCPGAATVRLWVSEDNCRLCTNSPGLSPAPS